MNNLFLTPKDVASILRLSVQQILRLTKTGKIPYVNFGCGKKRICPRYNLEQIQNLRGKNDSEEYSGESYPQASGGKLGLHSLHQRDQDSSLDQDKEQTRSNGNGKENISETSITKRIVGQVVEIISGFSNGSKED
jgi:hypothetical protein